MYLPSCHSTNDIAAELVRNQALPEGSVIITDQQTAGRGQHGTQWVTRTGQNFTFSILLHPRFLSLSDQFLLSQAVALGVKDYVARWTQQVEIKWPNDLYLNQLKAGGILIENALMGRYLNHSIIGIGLNMNQVQFESDRATSLYLETGRKLVLEEELPFLLKAIEVRYLQLRNGHFSKIRQEYQCSMAGIEQYRFFDIAGQTVEAKVVGVSPSGQLRLQYRDGTEGRFGIKEVKWMWAD